MLAALTPLAAYDEIIRWARQNNQKELENTLSKAGKGAGMMGTGALIGALIGGKQIMHIFAKLFSFSIGLIGGPVGLIIGGVIGAAIGGGIFLLRNPHWKSLIEVLEKMSNKDKLAFGEAVVQIAKKNFGLQQLSDFVNIKDNVKEDIVKQAGGACKVKLS